VRFGEVLKDHDSESYYPEQFLENVVVSGMAKASRDATQNEATVI